MPLDAVVIGPLNIDLILVGNAPRDIEALLNWTALSEVTLTVAGSAGYAAQVFQKLGLHAGVMSLIPDDALGEVMRRGLADCGIDLTRTRVTVDELSSIAVYMLLFGSKKRPLTGRPVTHQPWPAPLDSEDLDYLASTRLIHVGGYLHYPSMWDDDIPNMLRAARERGQMTSLDPQFPLYPVEGRWLPGVERLLPHLDVLLVDQDEARGITGLDDMDEMGYFLLNSGPRTVVVKCGADGVIVFHANRRFDQPALQVPEDEIADTVGAGDAFNAGFLTTLLKGRSVEDAARIGNAVAALSLRGHGAATALTESDTIGGLFASFLDDE
jgi:sugar/nucleoside kinase (ribokinase family)